MREKFGFDFYECMEEFLNEKNNLVIKDRLMCRFLSTTLNMETKYSVLKHNHKNLFWFCRFLIDIFN